MTTGVQDFVIYAEGLVSVSVCSSLPLKEVAQLMRDQETGVGSVWRFAEGENFSNGPPNPTPCDRQPGTHKHYLFHC